MAKSISHMRPDKDRDRRIASTVLAIIADGGIPATAAWHRHVSTTVFPFRATYLSTHQTKPFCSSAIVLVVGLASTTDCKDGLLAKVIDGQQTVRVPLELLRPYEETPSEVEPVLDWHYWVARKGVIHHPQI